jgi:hypothetical protein
MTKDDYDYWYNKWSSTTCDFDTPNVVAVGAPALCMCKDRPLTECPGEWEPDCDLGNNPAYVKVFVPAKPATPAVEPEPALPICRTDGRCQYAIEHGAEGLGHCPRGKCAMPDHMAEIHRLNAH